MASLGALPGPSMTMVKAVAHEVHRDVDSHYENAEASREDDLESSSRAIGASAIPKMGDRCY